MASNRPAEYRQSLPSSSVLDPETHEQYHPAALDAGHLFHNPDMERHKRFFSGCRPGELFGHPGK